jgi:N-methylhydantoinase A
VEETAQGIISVVTANMARAIRVISVHRGYDPRDYALVPFGGAGPLHAARLAAELGSPVIVVPEIPGAQSALGLLMTDVRSDFMRTRIVPVATQEIAEVLTDLSWQAATWFDREGIEEDRRSVVRSVDMRYTGQNYELGVEVPDGPVTAETIHLLVQRFHEAHDRMYGYRAEDDPVEAVTFRVQAVGSVPRAKVERSTRRGVALDDAVVARRLVYLNGSFVDTPVYDRARLDIGHRFAGPAIVEQMDSTTLLLPSDTCEVDDMRNLIIRRS